MQMEKKEMSITSYEFLKITFNTNQNMCGESECEKLL